jgi:glutathione S-transferase
MSIEVSAFRWVPPFAQGFVRDLRVRWALGEAGLPYRAALVGLKDTGSADYRGWQPFGQVPAYRDGEVEMFESGAIVLHVAAQSEALAPRDPAGWARVTTWVIAALNSVEPHVVNFVHIAGKTSDAGVRTALEARLDGRLAALAAWLGEKDYLEGRFTAGDLVMATVLRELEDSSVLARYPSLDAYRARCLARPAFETALNAQLDAFRENTPA